MERHSAIEGRATRAETSRQGARLCRLVLPAALATIVLAWGGALDAGQPALAPLSAEALMVDGLRRTVRFHVPSTLAARPALVIALHGSGGDGARFRHVSAGAFDRLADAHGAIVAYPDAVGGQWHDCRGRAPYQAALAGIDDVAFMKAIVRRASELAQRPLAGAFAVGYSNGGHLVFRLAWEAPEVFAGFAAITAHLPVEEERACAASDAPVSMLLISGTEDRINPWRGGRIELPGGVTFGRVLSAEETAAHFRDRARIAGDPIVERHPDTVPEDGAVVVSRRWRAGNGHEVVLMAVDGGGHTFPMRAPVFPEDVVGRASRDLDGPDAIWAFFARRLESSGASR